MSSDSARSSCGPEMASGSSSRSTSSSCARRGRRGSSAPRAIRSALRPASPKRSAIAASGSAASWPSVSTPRRSSFSGRSAEPMRAASSAPPPGAARLPGSRSRSRPTGRGARKARVIAPGTTTGALRGLALKRGGVGAEPGLPRPEPNGRADRLPRPPQDPLQASAPEPTQAGGLEEGLARPPRLDRGADPLQASQRLLPGRLRALGIGRHQRQLGAAGERLAEAHPGAHAERLGGPGGLSDHLRPAGLGCQRQRPGEQRPPALFQDRQEGEPGDERASDRASNICSYMERRISRSARVPGRADTAGERWDSAR